MNNILLSISMLTQTRKIKASSSVMKGQLKQLTVQFLSSLGTFRSEDEDEDDYEYEFSVLNMRIRFGGRHFSKCACSEQKTRTRSRPRPPI